MVDVYVTIDGVLMDEKALANEVLLEKYRDFLINRNEFIALDPSQPYNLTDVRNKPWLILGMTQEEYRAEYGDTNDDDYRFPYVETPPHYQYKNFPGNTPLKAEQLYAEMNANPVVLDDEADDDTNVNFVKLINVNEDSPTSTPVKKIAASSAPLDSDSGISSNPFLYVTPEQSRVNKIASVLRNKTITPKHMMFDVTESDMINKLVAIFVAYNKERPIDKNMYENLIKSYNIHYFNAYLQIFGEEKFQRLIFKHDGLPDDVYRELTYMYTIYLQTLKYILKAGGATIDENMTDDAPTSKILDLRMCFYLEQLSQYTLDEIITVLEKCVQITPDELNRFIGHVFKIQDGKSQKLYKEIKAEKPIERFVQKVCYV